MMEIRELDKTEQKQAIALALDVFIACGKADYDEEGLGIFMSFINDETHLRELTFWGAFDVSGTLVGMLAIREKDHHLSMFFIHPNYHRKGIGRALFDFAMQEHPYWNITVNSSTYAVPFYQSLGFSPLGDSCNYHGLVSVPMKRCFFRLRAWQESDVRSLARYLNNKRIWDNCRDRLPYPYTDEDARSFISYAMSQQEPCEYCIEINGEAVGNIGFMRGTDVERFNAEVGYWLAEPFWNQSIASEALREALRRYWAVTDVIRVFANVYESNIASMRVLEKIGFHKVGIFHKACFKNSRFVDVHSFELLKEDFMKS